MKKSFIKNTLLTFVTFAIFSGIAIYSTSQAHASEHPKQATDATSGEEVKREITEAAEAIKMYSVEQRDEALAKAEKYMNKLDAKIDQWESQLDANWDQMSQSAREKWRVSIKTLQKQRNDLSEWYGGMKHSSTAAWEEIKKGFSKAYISVESSLEKAEEKFKSEK